MTDEVTIPAGMKAWAGGDAAPDDWDGGEVLTRGGRTWNGRCRWYHIEGESDIIAYTPMTPEPAQPAESPEARALLPCPFCGSAQALDGDTDGVSAYRMAIGGEWQVFCEICAAETRSCATRDEAQARWNTRIATTARPTERGAVEGPSKEWCLNMARLEGNQEIGAGMPDHPLRAPGTATDQAAEVERLRADIRNIQRNTSVYRQEAREEANKANRRAAEAEKRADNIAEANRKLLAMIEADPAALATQPATGGTMGGEEKLRKALETMCLAVEYSAGCDEGVTPDDASSEIMSYAGAYLATAYDEARAALQNGGE